MNIYTEDFLKIKNYEYTPIRVFNIIPYSVMIFLGRDTPKEIQDILSDITALKIIRNYKKLEYYFGIDWFYTLSMDDLFDRDSFKQLKETDKVVKIDPNSRAKFRNRMASSTISATELSPQQVQDRERKALFKPKELKKLIDKPTQKKQQQEDDDEFGILEQQQEEEIQSDKDKVKYIFDNIFIDDSINDIKKKIFLYSNIIPEFQHLSYEISQLNFVGMTHAWIRTSGRRLNIDIFQILHEDKLEKLIDDDFSSKLKSNEIFLEDYSNDILLDIPHFNYDIYLCDFKEVFRKFSIKDIEFYTSSKIDSTRLYNSIGKKYFPQMKMDNFFSLIKGERTTSINKTLLARDYDRKYEMIKFLTDIDAINIKIGIRNMRVLQVVLHVNYHSYQEPFLALRGIFDYFQTNENVPFIKYRDPLTETTIKKIHKNVLQYTTPYELEERWIKGEHPQGIHFRIRQSLNKRDRDYNRFGIVNLIEDGKVALKCYWDIASDASFFNILTAIESLNNLLERINVIQKEITQKNRIVKPVDIIKKTKDNFELSDNAEFAFFNVNFKYLPKTDIIDYNLLDHVSAVLYPFVDIQSNKEATTYQGTYLRYKRISEYDVVIEKYIKNMKETFDFNDTKIVVSLVHIFNKSKDEAIKAIEEYNRKNNLPAPVIDSDDDVIYDQELIKSVRRTYKQPGVDIEIQDSEEFNIIKIQGIKSMPTFAYILNFLYRLLYIFENVNQFTKYQSVFKERFQELSRIFTKKKLGKKRVEKETKKIKELKQTDPELFDIDNSVNPKKYKLYSKLCQGDRKQPVVMTTEEIKKVKDKITYVLKNPNKTYPEKVDNYVCLDNTYKYPGFIQGYKHPKGHCLPCCYTSSSLDENKVAKIATYKKCLGDTSELESEALTNPRYLKQSNKELKANSIGKLPLLLNVYLNDGKKLYENKNNIIENGTNYYVRYSVLENNITIINIIADLLETTQYKVIKIITDYLKNNKKIFPSLENGRLLKEYQSVSNFIDYLENTDNVISIDHIWNILNYPNLFKQFPKGINMFCVFQDNEDRINLICPENDNFKNFYESSRPTLVLFRSETHLYGIYNAVVEKNKLKLNKLYNENELIVKKLLELYKERCYDTRLKGQETFKRITGLSLPIPSYTIRELMNKYKIYGQILNTENKCILIVYETSKKEKIPIPCMPSKPLENVDIIQPMIFNYNTVMQNLPEISKKTGMSLKPAKLIMNDKGFINTIVIETGARILVKDIKLSKYDLPVEKIRYDEKEVDKVIQENIVKIDRRLEQTKQLEYENELYNLFRYEISKYLNREYTEGVRKDIMRIIRSNTHVRTKLREMNILNEDEKREIVRIYQQEQDPEYIEKLLIDMIFSFDQQTKKIISEIIQSNETEIQKQNKITNILDKIANKITHISNKTPDLTKFSVSNIRQICTSNSKEKTCNTVFNCYFSSSGCKLFVPTALKNKFVENLSYELIRNPYKRNEILDDRMNYYINKDKYSKTDNEILVNTEKINIEELK